MARRHECAGLVVAVVRRQPEKFLPRVEGRGDVRRAAGVEVRTSRGTPGNRCIGQEREVVFASIRVDGTPRAAPFRDRVPGVARVLDDVDEGWIVQVRMVAVTGDAESAPAD